MANQMMWILFGTIILFAELAFGRISVSFARENNIPAIHPLSDQMIDHINQLKPLWKAGRNFNRNISLAYIRRLMGSLEEPWFMRLPERKPHRLQGLIIPKEFDARTKWTNCPSLNEIRDQGSCGSCWAVSAAAAMTDRYCITSKGKKQFRFSAENLMTCCRMINLCGMGCNGGFPPMAWRYFQRNGIVSGGAYDSHQGCQPYEMPPCEHHMKGDRINCTDKVIFPQCHHECEASYPISYKEDLRYGLKVYSVPRNVEQIQTEIMAFGPVQATFDVYEDFLSYRSGIYHRVTGPSVGGHAVKIVGWGEENGNPYWTIANSWNYDFGEKGYFRIRRGHNECGIEAGIRAGIPKGYEVGLLLVHAILQFVLHYVSIQIGLDEKSALVILFIVLSLSTVKLDAEQIYSKDWNQTVGVFSVRFVANLLILALFSALIYTRCQLQHTVKSSETRLVCSWDDCCSCCTSTLGSMILHVWSLAFIRTIITGAETLFFMFSSAWDTLFKSSRR